MKLEYEYLNKLYESTAITTQQINKALLFPQHLNTSDFLILLQATYTMLVDQILPSIQLFSFGLEEQHREMRAIKIEISDKTDLIGSLESKCGLLTQNLQQKNIAILQLEQRNYLLRNSLSMLQQFVESSNESNMESQVSMSENEDLSEYNSDFDDGGGGQNNDFEDSGNSWEESDDSEGASKSGNITETQEQ